MQPGKDSFKFTMEIDRLAAHVHRLGDRSITELRTHVVILAGLSADYHARCRMVENNPTGLERAEIERVIGNLYIRLLRQ